MINDDRRQFIKLSGATGVMALTALAGCQQSNDTTTTSATSMSTSTSETETSASESTELSVTAHEDIVYAEREQGDVRMSLYVPDTDEPVPLVAYYHGGGFIINTYEDTVIDPAAFAKNGYAVASVGYRLGTIPDDQEPMLKPSEDNDTPRANYPAQIVDAKAAIRWLRANAGEYGYDPDRIASWGGSAGAHIATLVGVVNNIGDVAGDVYDDDAVEKTVEPEESAHVNATIAWYPPINFLKMDPQFAASDVESAQDHSAPNSPESMLIGGQITEYPERVARANPITYIDGDDPEFLIMGGKQDPVVPTQQRDLLFDALDDAGVDAVRYVLTDLGHGFGFDALKTEPPISQTATTTDHYASGEGDVDTLIENYPPAGEVAVLTFLERHL